MRVTLVRTAYSSVLYEGEDFSCVLMDGDAQIVSMSKGQDHPLHIVPISWSMRSVREKFGDDIHPGDFFLHNDPYTGGTHLNDIAMIYPLFAAGRLFVFPVVRAHWGDVGGMSPGSLTGDATEIFQEGVRIPPIRSVDRGPPNQAALDPLFATLRGPRDGIGDFDAVHAPAREPLAPCGGMVEVKYCVETAVMGALAQALDGRVAGDLKGGGNHCYVGGPDPRTGETFIFYEYPAGGTGGFDGGDGSNTVRTWTESDMTALQPIEAVEQLYPVRIESTRPREDSGRPRRWPGGLGLTPQGRR